jgi:transposase
MPPARVDDRRALDAICFVLRTGSPWNAMQDTGLCSRSAAHHRVHAWAAAGDFLAFWAQGLAAYAAVQGLD